MPRALIVELAGCASRLTSLKRFCTGMTLSTTRGNSAIRLSSDLCVSSSPIAPTTVRATPRMMWGR